MVYRVVIAFVLVLGGIFFSFDVRADVTGSFNLDVLMIPEGRQTEAVKFDFDIRSNLQINTTISGVTFGIDSGFGTTGIEFSILNLFTTIGAFTLRDQFVFATPFYRDPGGFGGAFTLATMTSDGLVNGPTFVKKRITVSTNVAGVTMTNLAVFEDVDFPNPITTTDPIYNPGQVDSIINNQTPTYGFGDIFTLSGQTVSGIRIEAQTGLCLGRSVNLIKGRAWVESVNKACTASIGNNLDPPLEDGAKTPLLFDFHSLSVRDVVLGGVELDASILFTPEGWDAFNICSDFRLLDIADLQACYDVQQRGNLEDADSLTEIVSQGLRLRVVSENFSIFAIDSEPDLELDSLVFTANIQLNPNQNPATLRSTTTLTRTQGLAGQQFALSVRRGMMTWFASTSFGVDPVDSNEDLLDFQALPQTEKDLCDSDNDGTPDDSNMNGVWDCRESLGVRGNSLGVFYQFDELGLNLNAVMDFGLDANRSFVMQDFEISMSFAF